MKRVPVETIVTLSASQIADLRLASQSLTGAARRAFQAEMTLKHCDGKARLAEKVFGWGRHTVALGLAEKRTGIICVGSQSGFGGIKRAAKSLDQGLLAGQSESSGGHYGGLNPVDDTADCGLMAPPATADMKVRTILSPILQRQ